MMPFAAKLELLPAVYVIFRLSDSSDFSHQNASCALPAVHVMA